MSEFLTKEEILKIRSRGAVTFRLEALDRSIKIVKLGAGAQLRAQEFEERRKRGEVTKRELVEFMLITACTMESGEPIDAATASVIVDLVEMETLEELINSITESIKKAPTPGNSEASPSAA